MKQASSRVDVVINLTLIVVGIVTLTIMLHSCAGSTDVESLQVGQDVRKLIGTDRTQDKRLLVIALESHDPDISMNVAFYKHLTEDANNSIYSFRVFFQR